MQAYDRIASAIRYLETHHTEQPDLAAIAAQAGLSPYHFHRLFSTWAGVTPKDFLQCLTVAHAKLLLAGGATVFDAALGAGLSGPGRLHDLCVTLEAATPGELRSGGAGATVSYGSADSPFGACFIATNDRGICHLAFLEDGGLACELESLRGSWPLARLERDDEQAAALAAKIFQREPAMSSAAPLRAYVSGTPFQVQVWRALLAIPRGEVTTYGAIASVIGAPRSARAVGTAVGRNRLAYLIPCHRVIRETGHRRRLPVGRDAQAGDARLGERTPARGKRLTWRRRSRTASASTCPAASGA